MGCVSFCKALQSVVRINIHSVSLSLPSCPHHHLRSIQSYFTLGNEFLSPLNPFNLSLGFTISCTGGFVVSMPWKWVSLSC